MSTRFETARLLRELARAAGPTPHPSPATDIARLVTIRAATRADRPFLHRMLVAAVNWHPERELTVHEVLSEPELRRYVDQWGDRPGDQGLLAVWHGRPLGAVWLRTFPTHEPGYGFVDEAMPELSIGVLSGLRGKGIGTLLLARILHLAREQELVGISLSVERGNPALTLYERYGFVPVRQHEDSLVLAWRHS